MAFKKALVGPARTEIVLVPRQQLRVKNAPKFARRTMIRAPFPIPVPPQQDWTRNHQTTYPILGNNRYGDCYLVALVHWIQQMTAFFGPEWQPAEQDVVNWYLALSGGDNGLSDDQVFPWWKRGAPPPSGPHKLLDFALVDASDDTGINEAMFGCCGLLWTCALEDTWLNNTAPGSIWDAGGRPDPYAGHAMLLSGSLANNNLQVETWAITPEIQVTRRGMREADSELIACIQNDLFNALGFAPNGLHYTEISDWWHTRTGRNLPPSPYPPPSPAPPPPPPPEPPGPGPGGLAITGKLLVPPVEVEVQLDASALVTLTRAGFDWQKLLQCLLAQQQGKG